jgi:MerR family transcriptional regulator, copper efflux regulator
MGPILQVQANLNASRPRGKLGAGGIDVTEPAVETSDLVPIDEVARRFGIRASTIRYYEERGLLDPVSRHSGRRWYGPSELRRLAVIRYWQELGLMRLDDIGELLSGPEPSGRWAEVMEEHLRTLRTKIEQMEAAREFLEHVTSHHGEVPDGCPHYETLIWDRYRESGT